MKYLVDCSDGELLCIRFEPSFIGSNGLHYGKLGPIAMKHLCPKGWEWNGKFLLSPLSRKGPKPEIMAQKAQADVTKTIDDLNDLYTLLRILKESEVA